MIIKDSFVYCKNVARVGFTEELKNRLKMRVLLLSDFQMCKWGEKCS